MSRRSISLVWLCALLSATAVYAQEIPEEVEEAFDEAKEHLPPRLYAIESVSVSAGGSPVKGVDGGEIYSPPLSDRCWPTEIMTPGTLAGRLSEPISLDVSIKACKPKIPLPPMARSKGEPRVRCSWKLEPFMANDASCRSHETAELTGEVSWTGLQGEVELPPLTQTGAYTLIMACGINGIPNPPPIGAYLYVTYDEPLAVFSPPEKDWYTAAACWAGGLTPADHERDVIEAVLEGLYSYGQRTWFYGYAKPGETEGSYTFEISSNDAGSRTVLYDIQDEDLRPKCTSACKCYWQGMVAESSPCNFGDCYSYSDVLQAISGVMGVGGLSYIAITGEAGQGFLTEPAESLDPKFSASVNCTDHEEICYPYFFSSHSLRGRDGLFYDATFKGIYSSSSQSVALSKKQSVDNKITFLGSDRVLYSEGSQYGSWTFYSTLPSELELSLIQIPDFIGFTGDYTFTPTDASGDGIYDYLVAEVGVELYTPGAYIVEGLLTKEVGGETQIVARQPSYWSSEHTTTLVSGQPGVHTAKLYFSGQEIFQSGQDGPYLFEGKTHGADFEMTRGSFETPAFKYGEFGELDAAIVDGTTLDGVDADGDGLFDELLITVPITVRAKSSWALEARLASKGKTIGYAGLKKETDAGDHPTELTISGERIANRGLDGPWDLTLVLYNERLQALLDVHLQFDGYQAARFE